jgi:hypothetical protein
MQKAMRRTLGVGGATAVAFAATLALAGVASAHNHNITESCDSGVPTLHITLTAYNAGYTNTITAQAQDGDYLATTVGGKHGQSSTVKLQDYAFQNGAFSATIPAPEGASAAAKPYTFSVSVHAGDNSAYSFSQKVTTEPSKACAPETPPTKPTATTTTAPPTTTTASGPTSTTPPTTTAAAVAPVSDKTQTPPGGLAYTGVSTELPLIIAGALIVLGAGALITMRVLKRRRAEG